jgi:hypothetical protein
VVGLGGIVGIFAYLTAMHDSAHTMQKEAEKHLLTINTAQGNVSVNTFQSYLAYFGKSYQDPIEYQIREQIFQNTVDRLTQIYKNEGGSEASFHMIINEFADLTDQEFVAYATGAFHTDERLDTSSVFFDFDSMKEVDSIFLKNYFDKEFSNDNKNGTTC